MKDAVFPFLYRKVARIYQEGGYKGQKYYRAIIPASVAGKEWRKRSSDLGKLKSIIDAEFPAIAAKIEPLDISEILSYREAVGLLPKGISLMDAVRGFLHHNVKGSPTLKEAIEIYISQLKLKGVRRTDLTRYCLKKFEPLYPMRICDISTDDAKSCLAPHIHVPSTFKTYRNHLNTFYRWAIVQEYAVKNPVSKIVNPRDNHAEIKFYTPQQTLTILSVAADNYPDSVPYYALCLFAGIRPQTVERLDWTMVDFEKKEIFIAKRINKTNYSYVAHLPDNLIEWLKPHRHKHGAIIGDTIRNFRNRSERFVRKNLPDGLKWIQDGARHSWASYSYELNGLETTLSRMGDKSPYTLMNHYKGLRISKEVATQYFNLVPSDLEKVEKVPAKFHPKTFSLKSSQILPKFSEIA